MDIDQARFENNDGKPRLQIEKDFVCSAKLKTNRLRITETR